jgi:hypothetical protein
VLADGQFHRQFAVESAETTPNGGHPNPSPLHGFTSVDRQSVPPVRRPLPD